MPGSKPPKPAAVSFLILPLEIRNKIYKYILTIRHPIYIFRDSPNSGNIESFVPDISRRRRYWTALLSVNRQISVEARAILFGGNQFQLMEVDTKQLEVQTPSLLRSFLECIGPVNAASLSCLYTTFPAIEEERIGDGSGGSQSTRRIRFREDGLQKLQLLREQCSGLRVLDMVYTGSGVIATGAETTLEVLQEIDSHFRAIPSLSRIVIRVLD